MSAPNILFFGDNHGHFRHIIAAVEREKPDAIVLLGDIQAQRPLEIELAPILGKTIVRFIHGNHDTDSDADYRHLFGSKLADRNLHGRVENICGVRIAGLGGVFRGRVWSPPDPPVHQRFVDWQRALGKTRAGQGAAGHPEVRTHASTIFPDVWKRLREERADVLVTHEAPTCHPHGFAAIDELARALGVHSSFHGHHHDRLDYSSRWDALRFRAYGVGFCGITDLEGRVVRAGDFDDERANRGRNRGSSIVPEEP